jgi:molybdopterin-guanine dinucleotide biosynthesis protein A
MKTVVISGSRSNVGKTTLARYLCGIIPDSIKIKLGHGEVKPDGEPHFYNTEISYRDILMNHSDAACLIIESNRILRELKPDCAIFLEADNPKPSSAATKEKADIVSGTRISPEKIEEIAGRLEIGKNIVRRMAWLSGARPEPVTAVVLAGGKSSRMGRNKALLPIGKKTLISQLADSLRPWVDEIIVSGSQDGGKLLPGVRHARDFAVDAGPLMGLYTGLKYSSTRVNFVVACDMPEIDLFLLRKQISFVDEFEMVVPSDGAAGIEPLHGIYDRSVCGAALELLESGERRMKALLTVCRSKIVEMENGAVIRNLNSPDEYRTYRGS